MPERRIFSEQEVAALVRRAIELQEEGQDAAAYTPGVTLEELRQVAADIGLDLKYLDRAINEGARAGSKKGPLHLTEEFERVVDVELSPDDFDVVLNGIRPVSGRGQLAQVGRSVGGPVWTGLSQASLELSSRNGRTKVKVRSNALMAWLFGIHPFFIAWIFVMAGLGSRGMMPLALAISLGLAGISTLTFRALLKRSHKAARDLADRLTNRVREEGEIIRQNLARGDQAASAETVGQEHRLEQ